MRRQPAHLVLADGEVFSGEHAGFEPDGAISVGEAVFNTALSGYQEVLSDPSYAGQVITFTYPHIGNYGVTPLDDEANAPACAGIIVRDLCERASSHRAVGPLEGFLVQHRVAGITGVDTRRLTRHLRSHGALGCAFGTAPLEQLHEAARTAPTTDGKDLATTVACTEAYEAGGSGPRIVAIDLGMKRTIVRQLTQRFDVLVVPPTIEAAEVLSLSPDGVFLSNGPGDPAALSAQSATVQSLLGEVPIFGICLGQQVLAQALGARTHKLPFGHHGSNHPVRHERSGRIEVTAQNHNYAVDRESLPDGASITHLNLNDGVVEGFKVERLRAFCVQYHPEAGPGPHEARYLFDVFASLCAGGDLEAL